MLGWIIVIILFLLIVACAYAGHFFINAALFKNSPWYVNKGHKMLNPDNFNREKTVYTEIEDRQNEGAHHFWEREATSEVHMEFSGETLCAREFKVFPETNKWILAVHGYRSSGKRDMAFPAQQFAEAGYNVLVPDLRAHGKSTGEKIGMGWLEKEDVKAWVQKILSHNEQAEIILFGGSMGAATIMMASGDKLPKQVKMLIADCGYSSVYDEFNDMLRSALHLPGFPILFFANLFCQSKMGFSLKQASSVKQLQKNHLPALFIHGTKDKFVPHEAIYKNMEATQGIKESLLIEEAPHLSSWIYDEKRYFETVFQFIENNLEKGV
ncbi:alpha/beta hydrolase [Vagococcus carniphilus]|uniref:alpha/beta hydrolase n=1 Tax=Vagococcus carniphilus TaxID=218144 RepID=UPI00288FDA7F|nr:alpha/beta hydrolase [Vagococcus carniphilus]MDT2863906.1 alpha/beta hydrolase [Vagococcus carniphilus]